MRDSKRDTDVKNRLLDSVGEGEGGMIWENSTETCIFHIHMWNRSPVQCQRMRQGAQGWCTGVTLRDGMWREVGRGFRMGNPCTPMADSCQWWQKPLQYCKVISLQLNILKKNPNTIENKKIQWDEDSWVWHWGHCWPWWDQGWWVGEDSICLEEVWENRWRWSRDFGRSCLLKLSYVSRTVWPRSSTLTRSSEMLNARKQGAWEMAQAREALPWEGQGQQSSSGSAFRACGDHRHVSHSSSLHWHSWCFVGEEESLSQPFQGPYCCIQKSNWKRWVKGEKHTQFTKFLCIKNICQEWRLKK